jgi:hypothetical protein
MMVRTRADDFVVSGAGGSVSITISPMMASGCRPGAPFGKSRWRRCSTSDGYDLW